MPPGKLMTSADRKSVGIIGAGRIGQAIAQTALRADRKVVIANSRGPQSLGSVVNALGEGVTARTVKDASATDIVVLAVMWPDVPKAIEGLEWEGQIVIDPTNDFDGSDLDGRTSSEVVADLGGLREGARMQQVGAPLAGHNLIRLP
jgi:hypothetical protein